MENRSPRTNRILSDLKSLNFSSQNNCLLSNGYSDLSKNLKYLKKFSGDPEKVIQYYKSKTSSQQISSSSSISNSDEDINLTYVSKQIECEQISNPDHKKTLPLISSELPKLVQFLYLDGNNLLYVDEQIRRVCLTRKSEAERLFAKLILNFSEKKNIRNTLILFDKTNYKERLVLNNEKGENLIFEVESASPRFKNSDDALVHWAGLSNNVEETVFVTSDRKLIDRLGKKGAKGIIKTKDFFKIVQECLGDEKYQSILKEK